MDYKEGARTLMHLLLDESLRRGLEDSVQEYFMDMLSRWDDRLEENHVWAAFYGALKAQVITQRTSKGLSEESEKVWWRLQTQEPGLSFAPAWAFGS